MKKQLLLFILIALAYCNSSFAQVTPTPLDMSAANGVPAFIYPVSLDTVWAAAIGVNDFTWVNLKTYAKSVDAGNHWTSDTIPDPLDRGITEFFALNSSTAWAAMGDFNGVNVQAVYTTTDGGTIWTTQLDSAFTAGFFLNSIYFFTPDSGVAMGDPRHGYFEIYTTVNGGATWTNVPQADIPAPLAGEAGVSHGYSAVGDKIWFNTNTDGRIFYSADRGYHWSVSTVSPGWFYAGVAFSDLNNGVAWRDNNSNVVSDVYTSSDGAGTWIQQTFTPSIRLNQVSEIKNLPGTFLFTAESPARLYATTDNFTSYFLIDGAHSFANTPYWSGIKMFDAGLGWAADVPYSDSAVYKLQNLFSGISEPGDAGNINSFTLFPNPVTSGAALTSFSLEKNSPVLITLSDMTGKIISRQSKAGVRGENALVYGFSNVSAGMYVLRLEAGMESVRMKVVVK